MADVLGVPVNPVTGALLLIPDEMHSVDHLGHRDEFLCASFARDEDSMSAALERERVYCEQCSENARRKRVYYGVAS